VSHLNNTGQTRRRGRPRNDAAPTPSLDDLLQTSAGIFARDGYDGVSLRKLQTELNVSYTFFHHYFDSKEALWKAVIDRLAGATASKILATLQNIDDTHNELDALKEGIAIYIRSAFVDPSMYKIYQQESLQDGPRLDYIFQSYFAPAWQLIESMVAKVNQLGIIKPIPIESLFFVVQSATAPSVQLPFYQHLTAKKPMNSTQIETHIQQSIDLLFHGWLK
jgi:TetR/AcrR family transcriptional regulator